MRSLRTPLVLATVLGLSASIVHAQRPGAPRRPAAPAPNAQGVAPAPDAQPAGPGAGRRFGGPGGGSPAARLLGLRQQLELTDEQVKRLEALAAAPRPEGSASDRMRARADLMDAMKGDGNLAAARAAMDKMNRLRTDEAIARLKLQQDARAVLTPAQKTKLDNARQNFARRAMARGRGQGGRQGMRQGGGPGARGGRMGPAQGRGPQFGPPGAAQGFRQGPPMGPGAGQGMMRRRGVEPVQPDSTGR